MAPEETFSLVLNSLNVELFSSILNLLPQMYPIFTCVDPDPYSDYGSGSTKLLNTTSIWIRIHNTAHSHIKN